jgi:hypothetical protein
MGLTEYDVEPPYTGTLTPDNGATGVSRSGSLYVEVLDDGVGVDEHSVSLYVDVGEGWETAWTSSASGPGYSVTATSISKGYSYQVDRAALFPSYANVQVRVIAEDLASNSLDYTYSFRAIDDVDPWVALHTPPFEGGPAGALEPIDISLADSGSGVVQSSIQVTVDSSNAIVDGVIQPGWGGAGSYITPNALGGYDLHLVPDNQYGSSATVYVTCHAEDAAGGSVDDGWYFGVEDYLGPLVDPDVPDGAVNVSVATNIEVDVTDESGIVSGTLKIEVDGYGTGFAEAYVQGDPTPFKPGWDGPGSSVVSVSGGYRIVVDPVVDFPLSALVRVRVTAEDPTGNPERLA